MSVIKTGVLEGSSDSEEEVHVYKLKIHDTEVKDAGEWRVEVADKYGSTSTSCNLAIRDEPKPKSAVSYQLKGVDSDEEDKFVSAASARDLYLDPYSRPCRPRFVTFLKDQKAEEGFCVKFQCVVSGNPTPRVEWYKDMESVSRSSFMHTSYRGDGTACLQLFSPVADRDSGTYRCVARNSEGSCHSEAILSIQKQVTNADLRDQFSISRARTRNEELANFTGHHTSKFQAAERMLLKSDKYSFDASPRLKKSELYHLEPQFRGHRKSDLYTFADSRRGKKYETSEFDEDIYEKKSTYNIENDYKPRKRYEDDYKTHFKGKSSSYEFENDYKINKSAEIYNASYKYGSGKKSILEELDSQRKLESKKIYDSILSNRSDDFGGYGSSYTTKRTGLSKEINLGLSTKAKELSRGRSLATDVNLGRSKSMSLGRENSSRLFLDPKKGYYTLRPRPKSVAVTKDYSLYDSRPQSSSVSRDYPSFESRAKSVSVTRDVSSYDRRPKSMSVARDFDARTGYESDREEYISAMHYRPRSASFSRDLASSRNTRSASLAPDFPVKPKRELDDDEERTREREDRSRAASLTRDTEELIRSLRESSVGRSDFADIEAYRAELHGKQKKDKGTRSQTCKKKQKGKEVKYQMFVKHFADENKPIKEINPGLSMKAREIVNRQGYRYKVDRDLLNLSMSRNKSKSYPTDESDEDKPMVKRYTKLTSSREPESDEEEEVSDEAFKRKMYLQNLDRFINRANQSFDYMEDTEVPSWRKERLEDTGYDYTRHMARKNKIDLFDFDDIRTAKLTAPVNRQQQTRRAQSVGPEMGVKSRKPLNTKYDKERMALLNLGTNWVRDKPISFTERLKSKSVIEGNSVLLSCFVTGKEPFVVLWYRRGIPLPRDEEENFHIRSNGGFLSLEIPVASTYDTGEYMVEVRNEEGKIKSTCYIQVEPTFDPRVDYKHPEFIEPMHHVHVKAGQAATFSCRVKGHPIPFVRWFKDGIELQPTDRINIHQGEKGQAFLLIHDTEEHDTGLYKCEAQSMAGRCRSSATLQVLETLADAFDDVSCNLEVERIISRTKSEKGEVKEAPMLKPRAWRKGLETTQTQATESQAKQEETVVSETDTAKETPLKTSEILTVLDETLKAAQRVSSPIEKKTKPTDQGVADKPISAESPKPTAEVQASDVIDGSVPTDEEAPVVEVKESSEKPETPKTEKTDVPDGELMKEEVATKDTRASVEEAPEQREKLGTGVAESEEKMASESAEKAEKAEKEEEIPKEEEREPQPPTFVKKLPAKMDLKDGEDLLLQCITEGVPKPDVIWLHEKKEIEASQNTIIKDSHDVHSLEIKKVSHKDHWGSYTAKLVSGSSSSEEEEVVSTCKVFILSTAPAEQKAVVTEENIQDKDMIPLVERQISTEQEELKLEIPASVDLQEVCEEGQTDTDKMHIPVVSPTGVQCHSSPLDEASKEGELPPSQTSPHFSQPLEEELYPLERDENVRIQCVVAGEPCPKIVWFKDGEKLEPSSRIRLEWDPDTRIASVLLKRLHILDTGEYECIVYGENGSYSTKTTLHVKALEMQKVETVDRDDPPENVPPKCFLSLKDKKVYQGKSTTLDCVIKGVPEPEVKWLRHGKEIFSRSGKYILTAINQQYSLTVEDFKKSDEGCYTIEASNDSGSCSTSAYLTMEAVTQEVESVTPETSLPEFTSKMEGLMVPVGGTVTFKCSASGYPVPKFKWQKDMLDLYQSHRITVDNTPGETALTINDVNRRDGGMYVCVAKNSLGRIKQTAKLIVSEDCKETRRLSISGEMDRPDEQGLSQTDSSDKPSEAVEDSDDKGSEAVEEKQEESSQSKDNKNACDESAVNAAEPSKDTQQNDISLMQETPAVKEETSKVEDQTPTEESTEQKEAPKEEVKETLTKTEEAVASEKSTEEKEKAATVESEDVQKELVLEKAPVESVSAVEKTQIDDTHVEKVARKEEEKKEMEASEKTPVENVSTVEKSQVNDTHVEEVVSKTEGKREMEDKTVPSQEESQVQVPEEKIVSALKTVDSVEEVSLMENVDYAAVENVSLIKKEEKTTEQETKLEKEINGMDETDAQNIAKLNEKVQEINETSTQIEKREEEKKVNEIKDTKENVIESKSSASSEISKSEESTVKVSVQAAENNKAQKSTSEDVELDIDQLVQQAETILGETASAKPEVQDLSFEEVLAKSVLEESVAEAASEMEKVNKTKKRRLSKTKRRSQSLESEEAFSEKSEGEETTITKSKERNTEAGKSVTEVTESISQKESAALQKSSKTKSVSFEEVVKTSASSDMVDSSLVSLETSTSKMSVSKSESISTESSFELKENVEKLKISGEEDSEISVAKTEQTTSSATKTETRALDRLMSIEDVKEILDVDSLKMNETREAIVEQKTASGKTQVLEVSARRVSKQLSVEEQAAVATHRHHLHHPPEIIVPPENQLISLHSEIELTVKVRAAHGAKISWYHDGQKVAVTEKALKEIYGEHYELTDEEIPENQ
uniref:Muscle M-line assembly protein unc-89-like isoform X3 n=1 Tax=Crassostrea virginica TaxID=6565 RepID=A0A8B8BD88_CRAVI|nr:muscle M-line assembly protein unc-89-like isoform X3 [Crassostrea virginica]